MVNVFAIMEICEDEKKFMLKLISILTNIVQCKTEKYSNRKENMKFYSSLTFIFLNKNAHNDKRIR